MEQDVEIIAVNIFQTALEWWNEVPQTAISLISGAFAGTVSTFVAPWVQWGIGKKRERRQHRRQLTRLSQLGQAGGEFWGWEGAKSESVQRRGFEIRV